MTTQRLVALLVLSASLSLPSWGAPGGVRLGQWERTGQGTVTLGTGLDIYHLGSSVDQKSQANFGTCLAGGGDDNRWADAWRFLFDHADHGDVVIIREGGGEGGYGDWIFNDTDHNGFGAINSLTTLSLHDATGGNDPAAVQAVENAELVFFSGGDQANYVRWLAGSQVLQVIQDRLNNRDLVVGGTSAGMAYLAGIVHAARTTPLDSEGFSSQEIMADPAGYKVDLVPGVFGNSLFLDGVITETHSEEYDRLGRVVSFMARAAKDKINGTNPRKIRAIAASEGAAICFEDDGIAHVMGDGRAYFLSGISSHLTVTPGQPLNWSGKPGAVYATIVQGSNLKSLPPESSFDLQTWRGVGGSHEYWQVLQGATEPTLVRSSASPLN